MWRVAIAAFVLFAVMTVVTVGVCATMRRHEGSESAEEPEMLPSPAEEAEGDAEEEEDEEGSGSDSGSAGGMASQETSSSTQHITVGEAGTTHPLLLAPPNAQSPALNYGSIDLRFSPPNTFATRNTSTGRQPPGDAATTAQSSSPRRRTDSGSVTGD